MRKREYWRPLALCVGAGGLSIGELLVVALYGTAFEPNLYILVFEIVIFIDLIIISSVEGYRMLKECVN